MPVDEQKLCQEEFLAGLALVFGACDGNLVPASCKYGRETRISQFAILGRVGVCEWPRGLKPPRLFPVGKSGADLR